jgi:N-hydroxyarylamine O-acetyltransferase
LETTVSTTLDLSAYLARIECHGSLSPTLATLQRLHLAHVLHIPFENLDIQLGRPIRLDPASLEAKMVHGRRGGYCFEQNTLFALVLEQIGFEVTSLAARVRMGATRVLPRNHKLLKVEVDGNPWLADVGFGSAGLLQPIALVAGSVVRQFGWSYRLVEEPGLWVLQTEQNTVWSDMYAFTLEPQYPNDFEMANYYVSTHPESRFVRTLTVQRVDLDRQYVLHNRELTVTHGTETRSQVIQDDEILSVLSQVFGLTFPPGTQFRCLSEQH